VSGESDNSPRNTMRAQTCNRAAMGRGGRQAGAAAAAVKLSSPPGTARRRSHNAAVTHTHKQTHEMAADCEITLQFIQYIHTALHTITLQVIVATCGANACDGGVGGGDCRRGVARGGGAHARLPPPIGPAPPTPAATTTTI